MADLSVSLCGVQLPNPIIAASGTFGFGREYERFYDIGLLGAIATKALTLAPRAGNPGPRIAETPMGMLNSVGLQNPGVDYFIQYELPRLKYKGLIVIANIAGESVEQYCQLAEMLSIDGISMLEMNISCPNVEKGGVAFGVDPDIVYEITKQVKRRAGVPLIVKLSPNVTDITAIAQAAKHGGADAISLINTLMGMAIDADSRKPILAMRTGGLSGPAIKPIALRMVWQTAQKVDIPIIGMGGIMNGTDVAEFMLAGASAVMVGTANVANPMACVDILQQFEGYLIEKCCSATDLVGALCC